MEDSREGQELVDALCERIKLDLEASATSVGYQTMPDLSAPKAGLKEADFCR